MKPPQAVYNYAIAVEGDAEAAQAIFDYVMEIMNINI